MLKRSFHNEYLLSILLIGIYSLLAYGTFISQLGFYREDWYIVWVGDVLGKDHFLSLFQIDRPMMGYLYWLIYPLLGHSPLPWHIYALLVRLICTYSFFLLLRFLWPEHKLTTTMATVLFAIYPGFIQQRQANSFQVHLTGLTLFMISLTLMVYSNRIKRTVMGYITKAGALVMTILYPFLMEYYIGLEIMRVGILWMSIPQTYRTTVKTRLLYLLKKWGPYLIITLLFLFWRVFIFKSPRPATDVDRLLVNYRTNFGYMIFKFIIDLLKDIFETGFLAWSVPFSTYYNSISLVESIYAGILVLVACGLLFGFLHHLGTSLNEDSGDSKDRQCYYTMLILGMIGVTAALIPVVATNQNVQFIGREDRFTLPASIGVALMVTALAYIFILPRHRQLVFSVLIGLSLVTHFNYGLHMRDFWEVERQLWWQLSWRAPEIKPKTLLIVNLPEGFDPLEDHEIWSAANLIYYPTEDSPLITSEIIFNGLSYQIQIEKKKPMTYRGIWLNRHYEESLVVSMPISDSCLNVIDGTKYELSINEEPLVRIIAPFSHLDQIVTNQSFKTPSEEIFGVEPSHSWCYYYQKGMYNRQIDNWEEVARLGSEAIALHFEPNDRSEWMPFFEAFVYTENYETAQSLAKAIRSEYGSWQSICKQIETNPLVYPESKMYEKIFELLCQPE